MHCQDLILCYNDGAFLPGKPGGTDGVIGADYNNAKGADSK
mgnify:FL=1